jgi:leucyl aminopeptidase
VKIDDKNDVDCIYIFIFKEDVEEKKISYSYLKEIDEKSGSLVGELIKKGKITGKAKSKCSFYIDGKRYCVIGLGEEKKLDARKISFASGAASRDAVNEKDIAVRAVMRTSNGEDYTRFADAFNSASYSFNTFFREETKLEKEVKLKEVYVASQTPDKFGDFINKGIIISEAKSFARDLINTPSNYMTPEIFSNKAKEFLENGSLKVEIFDKAKIEKLEMGGLLGVGQGSSNPQRFMVVKNSPKNKKSGIKLALVGKGVTFDTGGISLKPPLDMHEMKADMSGAATVVALMKIIDKLDFPIEVVGLTPLAENMPDGNAINPGDILRALNGKTVEVLNTDAEGRLILMDALSYAVKHEKVTHIVDFATLTGAVVVALGDITAGVFSNNDELAQGILSASEKSGEYMWRLPLYPEYREQLNSDVADIANIGGRNAGSITAAKFLEEFVDDTPWAHIDIAGVAYNKKHDYLKPFATAEAVSTIAEWLSQFSS